MTSRCRLAPGWLVLLLGVLTAPPLVGQGLGLDGVAFGPLLLHDHVTFAFRQPALGDPFPHQFRQGYGFDGADLGLQLAWHWGGFHTQTLLRVTPAARAHWGYDQDTDTRPGTNFTHGNAGFARSRTFGIAQQFPLARAGFGAWALRLAYLRQWTRYHAVTTYDLNSNPTLLSVEFPRLISERAIVYELRPELRLARRIAGRCWRIEGAAGVAPLAWVSIVNFIPVVRAASSTVAYGFAADLALTRWLAPSWGIELAGASRWESGYGAQRAFRRETFAASLRWVWRRGG